jgi:hypothetical protein
VELVLRQQDYQRRGNAARGLRRRYVEEMAGLSRAPVTRLIGRCPATREIKPAAYRRHRYTQR